MRTFGLQKGTKGLGAYLCDSHSCSKIGLISVIGGAFGGLMAAELLQNQPQAESSQVLIAAPGKALGLAYGFAQLVGHLHRRGYHPTELTGRHGDAEAVDVDGLLARLGAESG